MVRTSELEEVGESLVQPLHFAEVETGAYGGDPTFPTSPGELVIENVSCFLGLLKRSVRLSGSSRQRSEHLLGLTYLLTFSQALSPCAT